jgi:hypothetical protein
MVPVAPCGTLSHRTTLHRAALRHVVPCCTARLQRGLVAEVPERAYPWAQHPPPRRTQLVLPLREPLRDLRDGCDGVGWDGRGVAQAMAIARRRVDGGMRDALAMQALAV